MAVAAVLAVSGTVLTVAGTEGNANAGPDDEAVTTRTTGSYGQARSFARLMTYGRALYPEGTGAVANAAFNEFDEDAAVWPSIMGMGTLLANDGQYFCAEDAL
ncbi:MAG: hypothetical protein JRI25_24715, partial [Deltaproteobacteria bacterium]|nr:hypothetical protein [Deltaproteobacteria bacterium]